MSVAVAQKKDLLKKEAFLNKQLKQLKLLLLPLKLGIVITTVGSRKQYVLFHQYHFAWP